MRTTRASRRGFSLIELLIVIMILGILAAITMPQFANASGEARRSSLASTVHTVSYQVLLYKLQHGDQLPDLAAASAAGNHFQPLTTVTTFAGKNCGPYIVSLPVNPRTDGSVVKNAVSFTGSVPDPVPGADFIYDYEGGYGSGELWGTSDRASGSPVR